MTWMTDGILDKKNSTCPQCLLFKKLVIISSKNQNVFCNYYKNDFFTRKIIRELASKTPKPKENVKKISSLKYLSCNLKKR